MSSITDSTMDAFLDLLQQFLEAMEEVFPECLKVKQYKLGLSMRVLQCGGREADLRVVSKEALEAFHESMMPYYARVMQKDETLLHEQIDLMSNIDLPGKWTPELDADTKEAIWEYIQKLCEQSNIYSMYVRVPSNMMTRIESMAHTLASQINQGDMSLSDLNIQQVSEQVLSSLSQDDLAAFAQNLQGSNMMENVSNMYSMMSSMLRSQQM